MGTNNLNDQTGTAAAGRTRGFWQKHPLGRTLSFAWRWSLVVTLPIVAIFGLWLFRTGTKYVDLGLEYSSLNNEVNLLQLAEFEADMLSRDLELGLQMKSLQPQRSLRTVELYLPGSSEAALNSDLPFSGREYVPGALVSMEGEAQEVKVRYRGDHYWHWAADKKSLRVKTKKNQLYLGMRKFNLVAPKLPEQISGYLSYFLAQQFDLIAPQAEMVDLYVNGSYRGIHLMLEQLEEMVLRNHRRMPGDVYAADIVRDERYRGLPSTIFHNVGMWEKIAINNHFDDDAAVPIETLTRVLAMPSSEERSLALRELLNMDAFGRFSAYRTMCQSEHFDNVHNWRLYYDPWKNRFEPIVWDPVGWAIAWRPKPNQPARADIMSSLLDKALAEDHAFLEARQRAVEGYFARGDDSKLLAELDRVAAQVKPSLASDPGLAEKLTAMTAPEVKRATKIYRHFVKLILDQIREDYLRDTQLTFTEGSKGPSCVRIAIDERRPLFGLQIALETMPDFPLGARLRFQDSTGAIQVRDVSGALSTSGTELQLELFLSAQLVPNVDPATSRGSVSPLVPAPGIYEVELYALDGQPRALPKIRGVSGHGATGRFVRGHPVAMIPPAVFSHAAIVADAQPIRTVQVWEGTRVCTGVEHVTDDVILQPGAILAMEPGASVIFEGHLYAEGTAAAPILVQPKEPDQTPWGTVAIRGKGADRSQLRHVHFLGGSGLKTPLAEYSAMFSVHNVQDVQVTSCVFRNSYIVDDMVHAVYSTIAFEGCGFSGALADALDIDITEAKVVNCSFVDNGNDSLDLMTSNVIVEGVHIARSGDKGISVGEDTRCMVVNTSIQNCLIGVQIKDRSRATLYNCDLENNEQGLDAYRKNWRYGSGGFGLLYKTVLAGNEKTLTADKHSMIRAHDCVLDPWVEPTKRISMDKTNEAGTDRTAKYKALVRFPEEDGDSSPLFESAWRSVDPTVRGAKPIQ